MGWNTTAVIMNDALGDIRGDEHLGKRLADSVRQLHRGKPVDVPAGSHCNAITLIEQHHADGLIPVVVGRNYGYPLSVAVFGDPETGLLEMELLQILAKKHGFVLRKVAKR